jgi:natural product biosynthesis luciferase-like monooxygenase protein
METDVPERIATLSPKQRELLELLRKKKLSSSPEMVHSSPADGQAETMTTAQHLSSVLLTEAQEKKHLDFSFFFFSDDGATTSEGKYQLLLECARFADRNGFAAIWTPERHFMPFGGLYPNPAVITAALAMVTERMQLRAGSVVLPLQNPVRVAEEWAAVDNLSGGRVGVAFASGWHPDDFVLAPDNYPGRRERMFDGIEMVKKLWRGETLRLRNGVGSEIDVRIFPNPLQRELPVWVTATSQETFVRAGEIGAHVLTGLMEQSLEQCGHNIQLYRQSLERHGFDPQAGRAVVMLHTFLGGELEIVKEKVRQPFCNYLKSFLRVIEKNFIDNPNAEVDVKTITSGDRQALLNYAFERYFKTSALLGTIESCQPVINMLKAIDVDEVACLLDFGLDAGSILEGLDYLKRLKDTCQVTDSFEHLPAN